MQRERLLNAAAAVFAEQGYAKATAEAISREAGMSKATFYEHFTNKEDAILALFDESAEQLVRRMAQATGQVAAAPEAQIRAGGRAFLQALAEDPQRAQTLLVEIIGAGPRAVERRDAMLERFASLVEAENAAAHHKHGTPRFRSPHDAFAIVGATVELCSRQLRLGEPEDLMELEPVIERLALGLLETSR
ncbi:HTH-type transcriptional repressor FabR [Capillimicrobium parvum]|uniref:HTH-type transcriptional repressor FabR n=1 Tax=Capillimicrobium parvum TaxID=2884022 RepID=A0A9E7C2Z4_9ACTN|nr:HTH-type transcriptional repressor FabR [Capillimicrobium parvum]